MTSDPQDWVFPTRTTLQREVKVMGATETLTICKRPNSFICYESGASHLAGVWSDTSEKGLRAFKRSLANVYGGGRWKIVTEEV